MLRSWTSTKSGIAAFAILLGTPLSLAADDRPRGLEAIVNAFVEVTLKGEHLSPSQDGYLPLTKWTKPITWTLLGDAPPRIEQVISTALERASILTDG